MPIVTKPTMSGTPDNSFISKCHQEMSADITDETKCRENQKYMYYILLNSGHKHLIYFPNMNLMVILKVVGKVTLKHVSFIRDLYISLVTVYLDLTFINIKRQYYTGLNPYEFVKLDLLACKLTVLALLQGFSETQVCSES